MSYMPARRGTILIPSGPLHDQARKHLFVICTDPCEKGLQLVIPISSKTNDLCDSTCVLQPHEHAFLKHDSFVFYKKARIESSCIITKGVNDRVFIPHDEMNRQSFQKIMNGICRSSETARKVKIYYGCPDVQVFKNNQT